jgi:hypothetical protein
MVFSQVGHLIKMTNDLETIWPMVFSEMEHLINDQWFLVKYDMVYYPMYLLLTYSPPIYLAGYLFTYHPPTHPLT